MNGYQHFLISKAFVNIWEIIRGAVMSNKELKLEVMALRSQIKVLVEKEKRYIEQAEKISQVPKKIIWAIANPKVVEQK